MRKRYAAMILALPTLVLMALTCVTLYIGSWAEHPVDALDIVLLMLVCHTIGGISAYIWLLVGIVGFAVGAWLLLTSRSRDWLSLGAILSMFPVIVAALAFFFLEYHGP